MAVIQVVYRLLKIALAAAIAVVLLAAGAFAYFAMTPIAVPPSAREFIVKKGRPLKGVARDLVAAGVLDEPWRFEWLTRLLGRATALKAGNYELPKDLTPYGLVEMIGSGQVSLTPITFIEGWTFSQMRQTLDANSAIAHDTRGMTDQEILRRIGATEMHPEGLFFPDSYFFSAGTSDIRVLERAYQTMHRRLDTLWQTRRSDLPYSSPYEALIMASIVEKETGLESERSMIAAVFINRLNRHMKLQTDPTVIYGLGEQFDGNLRKRDLETDTPYNTYTRTGLPPTPIAMPGQASLESALRPADVSAIYFVARGDGSSQFSNNLEDHNRAVQKYQLKH
jgi:UPF0755 protein